MALFVFGRVRASLSWGGERPKGWRRLGSVESRRKAPPDTDPGVTCGATQVLPLSQLPTPDHSQAVHTRLLVQADSCKMTSVDAQGSCEECLRLASATKTPLPLH